MKNLLTGSIFLDPSFNYNGYQKLKKISEIKQGGNTVALRINLGRPRPVNAHKLFLIDLKICFGYR